MNILFFYENKKTFSASRKLQPIQKKVENFSYETLDINHFSFILVMIEKVTKFIHFPVPNSGGSYEKN